MDRDELKQLIREVLAETLLGAFTPQSEEGSKWCDLSDAWEPLGYPSYNALYKDVQANLFRQGKEICDRRKPGAKIARFQINLAAARKRMLEDPSKRRAV